MHSIQNFSSGESSEKSGQDLVICLRVHSISEFDQKYLKQILEIWKGTFGHFCQTCWPDTSQCNEISFENQMVSVSLTAITAFLSEL